MEHNLVIGFLFFILGIFVIGKLFIEKTFHDFFWFCDFSVFLFALFFFFNQIQLIKSLINIGLLSQITTLILLLFGFASGKNIIGSQETTRRGKVYTAIEILIHITSVVALILTFDIIPSKISLLYSFIILLFMFFFSIRFTKPKENINLIHHLEIIHHFRLPFHTTLWMVYSFSTVLATFFLQRFLYFNFTS